jgi:hypothetical protein
MRSAVHFLPLVTTVVAVAFAVAVLRRYGERGGPHLLWWGIGLITYAVGTSTEGLTTLFGWQEDVFRAWYISGALLGGAPLAQGSVYLHLPRRTANVLAAALVAAVVAGGICVMLTPIDMSLVEPYRLSGRVMEWRWVRFISPFINLYAVIFLVGGAILSAVRFRKRAETRHRYIGNVLIAVGAILPGIGGTFTRMGYTEVLYVTELIGLVLIYSGYRFNILPRALGELTPAPASSPVAR